MTEASAPTPGAPREILAGLGDLTRKVRTAQRGTWFPLVTLGALLAGGIIGDRLTFSAHTIPCPAGIDPQVRSCVHVTRGLPLYWTLGLALVYIATGLFYVRRARNRGVGSVVRPYIIAGIIIALLIAPTHFWDGGVTGPRSTVDFFGLHFRAAAGTVSFLNRLTGRAISVGVPLLVLSWIERNLPLLVFTVGYLVIELIPITITFGGAGPATPWAATHALALPAAYLLLGALGFALAERREEPAAA